MQQLVWGHKGNLKSIDGPSSHKAAAPIDRGNNSAPEAQGQRNRGSRDKMDDTEGKRGKEGDLDKPASVQSEGEA